MSALFNHIYHARVEADAADLALGAACEDLGRMLLAIGIGDWEAAGRSHTRHRWNLRQAERHCRIAELILEATGMPLEGRPRRTFAKDEAGVIREASTLPPPAGGG